MVRKIDVSRVGEARMSGPALALAESHSVLADATSSLHLLPPIVFATPKLSSNHNR